MMPARWLPARSVSCCCKRSSAALTAGGAPGIEVGMAIPFDMNRGTMGSHYGLAKILPLPPVEFKTPATDGVCNLPTTQLAEFFDPCQHVLRLGKPDLFSPRNPD